ncbi:MAG: hypothetical protein EOO78_26350 [Oxalobacteraceae bacterium]|nr:MAG: hypothetical protein EOO78_26350 [Oxalobacteraceae bacterium]
MMLPDAETGAAGSSRASRANLQAGVSSMRTISSVVMIIPFDKMGNVLLAKTLSETLFVQQRFR